MRTKVTVALLGLAFAAGAILLWPEKAPRADVVLAFTGYPDTGTKARFGITNTSDYFMAGGRPSIEYLTPNGWTNYYDDELLMPAHAPTLHSGAGWCDERKLPAGVQKWRARVSYRLYPEDALPSPTARLRSKLRAPLGIGAGTAQSLSSEVRVVHTPEIGR